MVVSNAVIVAVAAIVPVVVIEAVLKASTSSDSTLTRRCGRYIPQN